MALSKHLLEYGNQTEMLDLNNSIAITGYICSGFISQVHSPPKLQLYKQTEVSGAVTEAKHQYTQLGCCCLWWLLPMHKLIQLSSKAEGSVGALACPRCTALKQLPWVVQLWFIALLINKVDIVFNKRKRQSYEGSTNKT